MNLLVDKRDQEITHEEIFQKEPLIESLNESSHDIDQFDETDIPELPKRRSVIGPLLTGLLVFIVAFVIVYFGFIKKSVQLPFLGQHEKPEETTKMITEAEPAETEEITTSPEQDQTVEASNQKTCIQIAPKIMNDIAGVLAEGVSINAMFFDEGSFSVELGAPNPTQAASIYQTLIDNIGDEITITSSPPGAGQTALIAGTFLSGNQQQKNTISSLALEEKLRDIADESGVLVSSVSISQTTQGWSTFLKLDGSYDACRDYLQRLSQQEFSVTISKLLLMPGQNGSYVFVLRFFV